MTDEAATNNSLHRSSILSGQYDPTLSQEDLIETLREEVDRLRNSQAVYAASNYTAQLLYYESEEHIPFQGMSARHVRERIVALNQLDNKPRLNTSSYVNVIMEPEEEEVALLGLAVNLADGSVYPSSVNLHDIVVNMIAKLWHAPRPEKPDCDGRYNYTGAGTVGSTEACLLAGLALKFRWRSWYRKKHNLNKKDVLGVIPNIVISTCYQAAWEKFFRYMDVEPRFAKPSIANKLRVNAKELAALCDEKTLGVVGIMGNHYNGAYDPIWEIDEEIGKINAANGWQIGIHVDAASGGFIAPFQDNIQPWDFRLPNVLSISASGHKFGESSCGTGWVVFRHREDLAEHIAISVTYLGGKSDSYTLNFSRPATATYVQYYKLLRMGYEGYRQKVKNQMANAKYIRDRLKAMKTEVGEPWFEIVDCGDTRCLPVLAARLNPNLDLTFDDIDIQHGLAESHWYVSGYCLSFPNPANDEIVECLLTDVTPERTMFRVVVKSNLDASLAQHLADHIEDIVPILNRMENGMNNIKTQKELEYVNEELNKPNIPNLRTALLQAVKSEKFIKPDTGPLSNIRASLKLLTINDDDLEEAVGGGEETKAVPTDALQKISGDFLHLDIPSEANAKKAFLRAVARLKLINVTKTNGHGVGRNSFAAC